jgi:hypothetical protein
MNENKTSPFTHLFNYGAICGLVMFSITLALWFSGIFPLGTASIYFFWIPLVFMYIATKGLRDNFLKGRITYWGSFKAQMLVVSSYGVLYVLLIYIFGKLVYTDLVSDYIQTYLRELGVTKKEMYKVLGSGYENYEDRMIEEISKSTLSSILFKEYFNKLIGGAFFALMLSFKLKRINPVSHVESQS